MSSDDRRGLFEALIGDGRPLLALTGIALFASGGFAILQSLTGHLLPHDSHALGMDAESLTHAANAHLTMFMFHDRVAFGGTLLAIGTAYWWLSEFPLRARQAWAWWAFAVSGFTGFASFLAYLGYGYLDTWHALATVILFPVFLAGLWRSRKCVAGRLRVDQSWRTDLPIEIGTARHGRHVLEACGLGLVLAGATIVGVGMTTVFVPQDLAFVAMTRAQIGAISPMLIPVIAHDRAGFGGGLLSCGLLILIITRHAPLTRNFLEVMALMGSFGFGAALGVHGAIGYLDFVHLAPAYAGLLLFLVGLVLCAHAYRRESNRRSGYRRSQLELTGSRAEQTTESATMRCMVCISVLYPNTPGKKFDHDYYAKKHMPMVMDRLKSSGMTRYEIDRGLAGGAPGSEPPFVCIGRLYFNTLEEFQQALGTHGPEILKDIPNYTDIEFQMQISQSA